jgi:hypothetical protein
MEQSPSWEAVSRWASQQMFLLLLNPNDHCHVNRLSGLCPEADEPSTQAVTLFP